MQDLIIYGAGGFGRETALMIRQINKETPSWNLLGFYDDDHRDKYRVDGLPVFGGMESLNQRKGKVAIVLAIADPLIRKQLRRTLTNPDVIFPVLIHPSVNMGDEEGNRVEEGSIICAGNILTTNIHIGPFVIVNLSTTIGHDVVIGEFSSVMPGCSLSGAVTIEPCAYIGTGVRILPGVTIGKESRIGAGAVVTKSVPQSVTVSGIPAKAHN